MTTYREQLIEHGLLLPSAVDGVYGRSGVFESVIEHFERLVTERGQDEHAEVMRFPPIIPRSDYERTNHLESFPDLLGSVHSFAGGDREHRELLSRVERGEEWADALAGTDVVLIPAACYPLYPLATGTLPPGGRVVDLLSFVYRHEPSLDPARMQSFRQREYVRIGTPEQALAHRDKWLGRAVEMLHGLGVPVKKEVANDPFFGRGGRMLAASQREQDLKYELTIPIASEKPTAIVSCNYHLDHFGEPFGIKTADGAVAHTACIGFGLERIALALFKVHGLDVAKWPADVLTTLGL